MRREIHYALTPGTQIKEFELDGVLGAGGFGITYKGTDQQFQRLVAIKEYLDLELVMRGLDRLAVLPRSEGERDNYYYGLDRFLEESRVLRFLKANDTAYLVIEYEEGETLAEFLNRRKEPLAEDELRPIFVPVLEGLQAVHQADVLHRDIKPGNIYLRK